jgi:malonyl CoA-acyl carrier protein transacylase
MKPFAFVFPGQGSQSVGMLDAWGDHAVVAQTLKEASDALGEDLANLIKNGPKEALALTTNTQPVMFGGSDCSIPCLDGRSGHRTCGSGWSLLG